MANGTAAAAAPLGSRLTANDRLKGSFNSWFWGSLAAAAVIHFAILAFWPDMEAADVSLNSKTLESIDIPQEVKIPPPPEQIARPAVPVISTNVNISEDITIEATTFAENPITDLPPPPTQGTVSTGDQPTFTPYDVKPELRNRGDLARILEKYYPPTLRDAGISATVVIWFHINESGTVTNTRVHESSGYPQIDEAATTAAKEFKFTPALNRDQKVSVWIQLPVTFRPR
jgi:protein TonB